MKLFEATILGIIQGLTEFLPVSSSGHLVIFQNLFGLKEPQLFFDVTVHMGTLLAIVLFFRNDIHRLALGVAKVLPGIVTGKIPIRTGLSDPDAKPVFLIAAGSVPTAIIGLALHREAERLFSSVGMVGGMLLLTGFLLWVTKRKQSNPLGEDRFTLKDALVIGLVQGIAVVPGISRSGSTIAAGLLLGLKRETAARFSFLLSIPAIIGAEMLALKDISALPANAVPLSLAAGITAGLVGYGALKLLVYMVKDGRLHIFAPYCWLAGGIAILLSI